MRQTVHSGRLNEISSGRLLLTLTLLGCSKQTGLRAFTHSRRGEVRLGPPGQRATPQSAHAVMMSRTPKEGEEGKGRVNNYRGNERFRGKQHFRGKPELRPSQRGEQNRGHASRLGQKGITLVANLASELGNNLGTDFRSLRDRSRYELRSLRDQLYELYQGHFQDRSHGFPNGSQIRAALFSQQGREPLCTVTRFTRVSTDYFR